LNWLLTWWKMVFWNTLHRRILLARKLSLLDWLALAEAWLGLFFFALALRLFSAERLEIPSRQTGSGAALPLGIFEWAERLYRLVELASRLYPLPMTCLPRALTLRWMLARRGIVSALHIGAHKVDSGLSAHAWVEIGDLPVGETPDVAQRFSRLTPAWAGSNLPFAKD